MSSRSSIGHQEDGDEVCPVCKSSRYLNPDMRFLINPECYHKMCESCVDRIFSSGPAPCPVAGCHKTLRKAKFRKQTFEDIEVEREVDIRRRVMGILNRREDEFDSKRAWDDFLEQRETIIMHLVMNIDVEKTEADLQRYTKANMDSIRANQARENAEASSFLEHQSFEQEQARLRRQAVRKEYDNERRELLAGREDILTRLAAGKASEAASIAREGQKVLLKKSSARRSEEDRLRQKQAALRAGADGFATTQVQKGAALTTNEPDATLIKGLKKISLPEPEVEYDPFGGLNPDLNPPEYFVLADSYPAPWLANIKKDTRAQAGGYDLREYYARNLMEAFAGLGCFIDEEVSKRTMPLAAYSISSSKEPIATRGHTVVAGDPTG